MAGKRNGGFTLIEVVVASTLLALLMTGLYQFISFGFFVWERGQAAIDEQQNLRLAVSQISREIRTAHSWDIGTPGPSANPSDTLELKVPDSPQLNNYRSITYYHNGTNILRDVNGAGHNVVAYDIKKLEFKSDSGSNLISIQVEGSSGRTVSTKAFMRIDKSFAFQR